MKDVIRFCPLLVRAPSVTQQDLIARQAEMVPPNVFSQWFGLRMNARAAQNSLFHSVAQGDDCQIYALDRKRKG